MQELGQILTTVYHRETCALPRFEVKIRKKETKESSIILHVQRDDPSPVTIML